VSFDGRVCAFSRISVCWAMDRCGTSTTAWLAVSAVVFVVWVLDAALAVVSEGVVAGVAAVVDCDVAAERGGSGCEESGWGLDCGAVV
jgi:hypothetical protein